MTIPTSANIKRSVGFLFGLNSLMIGANLVWVSYNTILLPTLVEHVITASRGLVVGLIGFFGTLLSILVSLLWGIISDHSSNRWGKRTPSILMGAVMAFPLIGLPALFLSPEWKAVFFPVALPMVILSYFGMQFFTNVSNGAWWPLLVDMVPENQRGMAAGMGGFLTLMGSAAGILVVTRMNQNGQTGSALLMIGGIFTLTGIINVLVIKGKDKPAQKSQRINLWEAMSDMFKVRRRVEVFFWLVLAMLLANMGFNSLQFFARYFFEVYFPMISPDAGYRIMGGISLVVMMLSAVGSGILSDKIGRRTMILWAMVACGVSTLLMGFTSNFMVFLVFTGLRSIAMGPILATAPALASDLAPKDEAGHYMAYNNISTSLSGALSSLIFGVLLAQLTQTTFEYLFIISAILFLVGAIVFSRRVTQSALDMRFEAVMDEVGEMV
ncbi:MAG: MFS transporter [Anaerolineales bacterium]